MTPHQLDTIFPYLCFAYGAFMTITLNMPALVKISEKRMPPQLNSQWQAHRGLALICLAVGTVWILQNLWLA